MKKFYNDIEVNGKVTLKNSGGGGAIFGANPNGNPCVELGGNLYTIPHYRIGDIFLSTVSTSPSERFGGNWEQISADAYLKIITSGAGNLGGANALHKIPKESLPPHSHPIPTSTGVNGEMCLENPMGFTLLKRGATYGWDTFNQGVNSPHNTPNGYPTGKPYYPYYYGIYAWVKRA